MNKPLNLRHHQRVAAFCGTALLLASSGLLHAQTAPVAVALNNPVFADADGDKVPDQWRASAPAEGDKLKVAMAANGEVQILDQDKESGAGLAQYVAVTAGHKYKFTAQVKGSGGLWIYLQFLDKIPAKEGEISKHRLADNRESTSASPDFKEFSVTATAPPGATQARVWFYCPKIGVTDSVVKEPKLEDLGAVPMPAAASPAATTPVTGVAPMPSTARGGGGGIVTADATVLANPDMKDADGDNIPDGWRVFPDASGDVAKVSMVAAGGVQVTDSDKTKGIGLQQQLPAQEGMNYSFSAVLQGSGSISLNMQFLSGKPARDSDLRGLMINQSRVFGSGTPEGKEVTLTAKAPAGTKFMRLWLYSPNIGLTDVVVTKTRLDIKAGIETAAVTAPAANDKLLFVGDFESGNFDGWEHQFPHSTEGTVVTSPVRAGKYAVRDELTYADFKAYGDSRNRRCEVLKQDVGAPGQERWYGFSVYLPKDWEDNVFDIVMQIHNHPDPGEGAKSPILTLETEGKDWKVNDRWDKEKISVPAKNGAGGTITTNRIFQGPYETEKWTDWVFHVKWSLSDDGLIEVWKDGQKVAEYKGPNGYNDEQPYYLKMGVYKPAYRVTAPPQRVIYHDELRIGNEKASYADVAPGGGKPALVN